jgi:hypothetical protein
LRLAKHPTSFGNHAAAKLAKHPTTSAHATAKHCTRIRLAEHPPPSTHAAAILHGSDSWLAIHRSNATATSKHGSGSATTHHSTHSSSIAQGTAAPAREAQRILTDA